jgi:hypothetical protein
MRFLSIVLVCLLGFSLMVTAQQGKQPLKGKFELKDLLSDPAYTWFHKGVNTYDVNMTMSNMVKSNKEKVQFISIVNLEDEKNHALFAQFMKTMILASVPSENLLLYASDKNNITGNPDADQYKVKRTPVFIVRVGDKEIGRVSGAPKNSIEQDLAEILMRIDRSED